MSLPPGQYPAYLTTSLIPEDVARSDGELLKESRSYCPTCMRELDAAVYAIRSQVWLYKRCPEHGPSQGLVERDVAFYRAVMNRPPAPKKEDWSLLVPVTHRCNLDCSICFVPRRSQQDMPVARFTRIIDQTEVPWIVMSGGEPTLRPDLTDLIVATRRAGKFAAMNSNGVLLSDRDLVRRLADAGLEYVLLSFNGASDSIYQRINGLPLLDLKTRAIQNLVDEGVELAISPTIIRGVNENLGPVVRLCFDNAPTVDQLRLRGAAQVGRHGDFEPLVLSELVGLLAPTIGRTVPVLLEEFDPDGCYHSVSQWIMDALFFADGDREGQLLYWDTGEYRLESSTPASMAELERRVRRELGDAVAASPEALASKLVGMSFHLWHWMDRYNIDLEEIKAHGVLHLHGDQPINMVEAFNRAFEL
jgi:pyruvate-formate lyase-activating enzyme